MSDIIKTQCSFATKAMHHKAERGAKCEQCGRTMPLDLHHRQARRYSGKDTMDNAELLCRPCHVQTPTFGDHSRLQ